MKLGQECFIVRDANGHALAYVYFEDEPRRPAAAQLLTCDEARRIAANTAKLPEPSRPSRARPMYARGCYRNDGRRRHRKNSDGGISAQAHFEEDRALARAVALFAVGREGRPRGVSCV